MAQEALTKAARREGLSDVEHWQIVAEVANAARINCIALLKDFQQLVASGRRSNITPSVELFSRVDEGLGRLIDSLEKPGLTLDEMKGKLLAYYTRLQSAISDFTTNTTMSRMDREWRAFVVEEVESIVGAGNETLRVVQTFNDATIAKFAKDAAEAA